MKRILTASLSVIMLLALTACGTANSQWKSDEQKSDTSSGTAWGSDTLATVETTAAIEETVLVDEQGIRITATGLNFTPYSVEVVLTLENNSDTDLSFASGTMGYSCNSVNGYMMAGGYLYCDVPGGKKVSETVSFLSDSLQLCGIREVAEIELGFDISDDRYNHFYTGPRQIQISAFASFDPQQNAYQQTITGKAAQNAYQYELLSYSDDVLYQQNDLSVISAALIRNQDGGDALLLEAWNQADQTTYLVAEDIAINGLTVYSSMWTAETINPGKRALLDMDLSSLLSDAQRTACGIDGIGTVSFTLKQTDAKGVALTEPVNVTVSCPGGSSTYDATGLEVYSDLGIRLIAKDIIVDDTEYSSTMHLLLLAENNSGIDIRISDAYDSLSINGYMIDYSYRNTDVKNGTAAMLDVEFWEDSLEASGITSPDDIQELEMSFELEVERTTVATPSIRLVRTGS